MRFIYCSLVALLTISTITSVYPVKEVYWRNQAVETSAGERKSLRTRFREWKQRRADKRVEDATEQMSASIQSIDSAFMDDSRRTILNARDTMTFILDMQADKKGLAKKYLLALSRIPTEESTAFAIYLKDALIGYDTRDLAAPFFAFRIKGRSDLIAVIEPHLAEHVRNDVNDDLNQMGPVLAAASWDGNLAL